MFYANEMIIALSIYIGIIVVVTYKVIQGGMRMIGRR